MPKTFKAMIALGIAVAAGSSVTAMYLGTNQDLFNPPFVSELELYYNMGLADFNGDGIADVAQLNVVSGMGIRLQVYKGNGTGQFELTYEHIGPKGVYALNDYGGRMFIADVNADGHLDIISPAVDTSQSPALYGLAVFLNNSGNGFICVGDIDDNGQTDVDDLLDLIADYGCDEGDPLN